MYRTPHFPRSEGHEDDRAALRNEKSKAGAEQNVPPSVPKRPELQEDKPVADAYGKYGREADNHCPDLAHCIRKTRRAHPALSVRVDKKDGRNQVPIKQKARLDKACTRGPYEHPFLLKGEAVVPEQHRQSGDAEISSGKYTREGIPQRLHRDIACRFTSRTQ